MNRRQTYLALLVIAGLAIGGLATDRTSRALLLNSLELAVGACAISLPLGTLLAVVLARTDVAGRRVAAAVLGLLLFLPLFVQLAGWDALFGKLGWWSLLTGSIADPWLAGMRGAIWVHGMAAVPWVALIVSLGLLQVEPQLEEVALLDASPAKVLMRVTLPRSWPFLIGAAVWTMVGTTSEMTVTNIYLVNTYTEQLYNGFALNTDPLEVGWRLWPGIALLAVLGGATLLVLSRLAMAWDTAAHRTPLVLRLAGWRLPVTLATWTLIALLIALPTVSLVLKAGRTTGRSETGDFQHYWSAQQTLEVLADAPHRFRYELVWSLLTAAMAATAAVTLAIVLTWHGRRGGWRLLPLATAVALGLAIPGPLIASTLIWLLNRESIPGFVWLYDRTLIPPALAQMIRALPIAVLICWPALTSVRRSTLEAAELDGAGDWTQLWRIALPQRAWAMAAAWIVAAAVSLGDLSYSLLVIPPGKDLLQRRIFGLVHAGVDEQVAAACLLLVAGYAVVAGALMLASAGRAKRPATV